MCMKVQLIECSANLCASGMQETASWMAEKLYVRAAILAFGIQSSDSAYPAIIGATIVSGYVTFGATVIANHHGVDARYRTVRISWY
jgi:hypothetical protein